MAFEFRLPDIGEGVVEGEVVRWMVKVGDLVREDQPLVEVMTDKATVEIPSPKAGRIASITAPEGKMCAVGQVMVTIDTEGRAGAVASVATPVAAPRREVTSKIEAFSPRPVSPASATGKVLATPATRRLARDLGVDLMRVLPSATNGRVSADDVRAAASGSALPAAVPSAVHAPASAPGDERLPLRGVRKKIAENMARSKRTAAHFTYVDECDVTDLVALRSRSKAYAEQRGIKLSFLPFIVKAVVSGLKKYPMINSTLDEPRNEIVLRKEYHIGVAATAEEGLLVPVLRNADQRSIFDIARDLEALSAKARTGKATREELTGSTFTISSLGALGGVLATPIINHPEVAILGVHKIKQSPVVRDGQVTIRDMTHFSISLDHRVVDGYEGALFLQHVIKLLTDPALLFLELV